MLLRREKNSLRTPIDSVDNNVPQSADNVKRQSRSDADYLSAVKRGDIKTAQRMVDEAAKAAGYDTTLLYQGTRKFGFTAFDLQRTDDGRSIFLTDNENIASTYSDVTGIRSIAAVDVDVVVTGCRG